MSQGIVIKCSLAQAAAICLVANGGATPAMVKKHSLAVHLINRLGRDWPHHGESEILGIFSDLECVSVAGVGVEITNSAIESDLLVSFVHAVLAVLESKEVIFVQVVDEDDGHESVPSMVSAYYIIELSTWKIQDAMVQAANANERYFFILKDESLGAHIRILNNEQAALVSEPEFKEIDAGEYIVMKKYLPVTHKLND